MRGRAALVAAAGVRARAALGAALMALAVGLSGCGSADRPGNRIHGKTLTIYFSGPMHGASSVGAVAALNGARMALSGPHARVGSYRVVLKPLDDSTPPSHGWDPSQTTLNARLATQDPTSIGYIGDFNSGASAVAIPLLNRAGIAQVSPGSTAVGLTTIGPGASPGEPAKYYPTGVRTFARVLATDASQADALVRVQKMLRCTSTVVLQDAEVDGEDTALTFVLTAKAAGLRVVAVQAFQRQATDYTALASSAAASGANCVLVSAIDESSSVLLTEQIARALPRATIFASNGLADSAYLDPSRGGIPGGLDPRVIVVSAAVGYPAYPPSADGFFAAYSHRFGAPEPPAVFGYQSMKLMLAAIAHATDGGRKAPERSRVAGEILSRHLVPSPLGAFQVDSAGDMTVQRYGVYRVVDGRLSFVGPSG